MNKPAIFASILAAALIVAGPAAATSPLDNMNLPSGSGAQGLSTGIAFWPSSGNSPGTFRGIMIESVQVDVTRVQIVDQFGARAVLYDGPISAGQFIPFSQLNVAWTAWNGTPGAYGGGVKVIMVYE